MFISPSTNMPLQFCCTLVLMSHFVTWADVEILHISKPRKCDTIVWLYIIKIESCKAPVAEERQVSFCRNEAKKGYFHLVSWQYARFILTENQLHFPVNISGLFTQVIFLTKCSFTLNMSAQVIGKWKILIQIWNSAWCLKLILACTNTFLYH